MAANDWHAGPSGLFQIAWKAAAESGVCDSAGGAEMRRVMTAWFSAGCPRNVAAFIQQHANKTPENHPTCTSPCPEISRPERFTSVDHPSID